MSSYWWSGTGAVACVLVGGCVIPERNMAPGINDVYQTTELAEWVERFEGESREIYVNRERVASLTGVEQGMAVADVGAGTGLFTEIFAERVGPTGKVYAVDILPDFMEHIDKRMREAGHANVETVLCTAKSTNLPPQSVDLVFLCDVYHHLEYPGSSLASIRRALKPEGRLVVVDFQRIPGVSRDWILKHVRADEITVIKEAMSMGFVVDEELTAESGLVENYFVVFGKR